MYLVILLTHYPRRSGSILDYSNNIRPNCNMQVYNIYRSVLVTNVIALKLSNERVPRNKPTNYKYYSHIQLFYVIIEVISANRRDPINSILLLFLSPQAHSYVQVVKKVSFYFVVAVATYVYFRSAYYALQIHINT